MIRKNGKRKFRIHDEIYPWRCTLEVGIEIFGPKKFVQVYESYFHTLSAALLIIKAFPELTEVIRLELRKKQKNIQETIENILKEKEKHM